MLQLYMKVALLDIKKSGDHKDLNGGFGTTFFESNSLRIKILSFVRTSLESIPTMSYAYLSAIFKKYGHSVKYYSNEIPEDSDVILIHVSLIRHNEEIVFIKNLKKRGIKKVGIYGPLAFQEDLFKDADFIIQGEPEEAIIKISKTGKIPKGIVKSKPIMNLDELPFPDWSIFSLKNCSFAPSISVKPSLPIHASRGCPYACSYCPYLVFGTYRVRKPEKVVEELIFMMKKYAVKGFYFRDPSFSIDPEKTKKLANLMIEKKLNLEWGCETRLDLLTIPLLKLLYKAGLRAIKVGIESLNHDILKNSGRIPPKIKHQEEIIHFCEKIGIKVIAFYIIALPSDTKKSIKKTINYSRKLNTSFANFTICTPIPGTPFHEEIKDKITEKNLNSYDNFHIVFKHDKLSKKEIINLHEKAIIGYYFRPRYIIKYIFDKFRR